jgi:nitroreductase
MNAIRQRRSIRKYTPTEVPEELLIKLLEAAMCAPSAGNQRPWHFVVIRNRPHLQILAEVSPYAKMLSEAAAALLVCGDLSQERHAGFWVQDCAAATENILLEATELGLGAVWLGIYPREDRVAYLRKILHIPEQIMPFALIPVGYPAETKEALQRYEDVRVHWEQW